MNAVLVAALCIVLVFLSSLSAARLMHMLVPSDYWVFAEKMIAYVIVYLCGMPFIFSLIRCWKAHTLWESSFLKRLAEAMADFSRDITFARRLFIYFSAFLVMNLVGAGWITWMFVKGGTLQARFIAMGAALVLLLADGWFFRKLYRKQVEFDLLAEAVRELDSGAEAHLDLKDFEGREAALAATINNVSAGLQKALNDQVRSERMKAELITNVSHDIKTPLTSIINYVDLLKRRPAGSEGPGLYQRAGSEIPAPEDADLRPGRSQQGFHRKHADRCHRPGLRGAGGADQRRIRGTLRRAADAAHRQSAEGIHHDPRGRPAPVAGPGESLQQRREIRGAELPRLCRHEEGRRGGKRYSSP